jgi:hypothetical protein
VAESAVRVRGKTQGTWKVVKFSYQLCHVPSVQA